MENPQDNQSSNNNNTKKTIIKIPSYQEVIDSSQSKSAPPSLFTPSPSFSQAFSFLKSSEFYSPPPPAAAATITAAGSQQPPPTPFVPSLSGTTNAGPSSSSLPSSSSSFYAQSRNAILVSPRQKGNPLLKHIRNVRWAFADVICDYFLGQNSCALYLSLRYHLLHPDYLYYRIRELQKNFKLRVVLCHVDVEDVVKPLLEVTKTALLHECTLLCAWSLEECGRYLETIKVYENKPADIIQGQMDTDYLSRLTHALTTVRHINKTDVVTLGSTFGSLSHIMDASMEDLARCPGIGERKKGADMWKGTIYLAANAYRQFHPSFIKMERRQDSLCYISIANCPASFCESKCDNTNFIHNHAVDSNIGLTSLRKLASRLSKEIGNLTVFVHYPLWNLCGDALSSESG